MKGYIMISVSWILTWLESVDVVYMLVRLGTMVIARVLHVLHSSHTDL